MAYQRFKEEDFTHTIDDTIRAEIQTFLKGYEQIQAVVKTDNGLGKEVNDSLHNIISGEMVRAKQMRKILKDGGIVDHQVQETIQLLNKALDMIETDLTAYNTFVEKYGPKG